MSDIRPRPIRRRSLHDELVERIRNMVLEGSLPAGGRVPEKELCEQFEVSRTPLREALKVLASEGLLELMQNRGAVVTPLTARDVEETFPVLASLELTAGEMACRNIENDEIAAIRGLHRQMVERFRRGDRPGYFGIDQKIHESLVAASGNSVLAATHRSISARLQRARYAANISQERWKRAVEEHDQILAALEARNGKQLGALLKAHLENKAQAVLEALRAAERGDTGQLDGTRTAVR